MRPLTWSISAVRRKEEILSWSTATSPAYMKLSSSLRSSSRTSRRITIGCWHGFD